MLASFDIISELLNSHIGAIHFGLILASYDYSVTIIFVKQVAAIVKKCG